MQRGVPGSGSSAGQGHTPGCLSRSWAAPVGCQAHTRRVSRSLWLIALLTRQELNTGEGSCVACHFMPRFKHHFDNKVLLLDFLPKAGFLLLLLSLLSAFAKAAFPVVCQWHPLPPIPLHSRLVTNSPTAHFWAMDLFHLCHSKKGPQLLFIFYFLEGQLQANYPQQIALKHSLNYINCYKILTTLKPKIWMPCTSIQARRNGDQAAAAAVCRRDRTVMQAILVIRPTTDSSVDT